MAGKAAVKVSVCISKGQTN